MALIYKIALFIIGSGLNLWISRHTLRDTRSHGFFRFFAFEAILVLTLVNLDYWFDDPLAIRQLISWILLSLCLVPVTLGYLALRSLGAPGDARHDEALIGVERTTRLVTTGVYGYIRHPIYSAGLIGTWGVFLKHPDWLSACLGVASTVFWIATAKAEERENVQYFGGAYESYMQRTRMFIPYLY
jgi:protein-S-isoprenylcysteine O-methyltransferase Ste14